MSRWIEAITLIGEYATLEPLTMAHKEGLGNVAMDGELWKLWYTMVPTPETAKDFIQTALDRYQSHSALSFAVRDNESGKIIGSTSFLNIDETNQRVEIGSTWYAKSFQRRAINTNCKLLLLTHAFEQLDAIAVEFRTHWHNQASRRAIERLGAKQDGILRNHWKMPNGGYRDTVVFSIINSEWPSAKQSLEYKLNRDK